MTFKTQLLYELPKGFLVGANYTFTTGMPWARGRGRRGGHWSVATPHGSRSAKIPSSRAADCIAELGTVIREAPATAARSHNLPRQLARWP